MNSLSNGYNAFAETVHDFHKGVEKYCDYYSDKIFGSESDSYIVQIAHNAFCLFAFWSAVPFYLISFSASTLVGFFQSDNSAQKTDSIGTQNLGQTQQTGNTNSPVVTEDDRPEYKRTISNMDDMNLQNGVELFLLEGEEEHQIAPINENH